MKYFGGVIVLLYGLMAVLGFEPFSGAQRGKADGARGTVGAARYRSGSFMGGK